MKIPYYNKTFDFIRSLLIYFETHRIMVYTIEYDDLYEKKKCESVCMVNNQKHSVKSVTAAVGSIVIAIMAIMFIKLKESHIITLAFLVLFLTF